MGNIEIIKSKHVRTYDEMNNEIWRGKNLLNWIDSEQKKKRTHVE